ncbi:MAG: glycosyltransferase family 87 protein [bacterium]
MKNTWSNIFLILAILFHLGMLVNLAMHFEWHADFSAMISPRKIGAKTPEHWNSGNGIALFAKSGRSRFEEKWRELKRSLVNSKELNSNPARCTDNFGLDFLVRDANNADPGGDFFQLYQSGIDFRRGTSIYENYTIKDRAKISKSPVTLPVFHPPNRYPPGFAYTIGLLLSMMKPWMAYFVWVLLHEIVLVLCIVLSYKAANGSFFRFKIAAAMWLAFLPWYLELYLGQTTFILMAATFILALYLDDYAGALHAGTWWTASLVTKPVSLLYAPVLIRKRRPGMLMIGLGIAIGSAAVYFLGRPMDAKLFLKWMSGEEMVTSLGNYCFQALLYRFHRSDIAVMSIALGFIFTALYMTFRSAEIHSTRLIVLWVCVYFLSYTHVWEHHLVLFLPVLVLPWLYSGKIRYVVLWFLAALPSSFYLFNNNWNWTRELLYLSCAAAPVLLLFADQLLFNTPRALQGE